MVNVIELGNFRVFLLNQRTVSRSLLVDGHVTQHAEDRLQFRKAFLRCLWTRELFVVEGYCAVRVLNGDQ